jgi:hypothetical protein
MTGPESTDPHADDVPADQVGRGRAQGRRDLAASDDRAVQRTRAWTGLLVVVGGDVAIAIAAILGIALLTNATAEALVAILTSAFTAISSMTSAYFGIRAAANAAQGAVQGNVQVVQHH